MRKFNMRGMLLAAALLGITMLGWAQQQGNEFHWKGQLAPDKVVEIKGVNGSIDAEGISGNEIQVDAVKSGPDADRVRVEVVESPDGVTICAVYPNDNSGSENRCTAGEGWHTHTRNVDARVAFTVRLPKTLRFSGQTVNGKVTATGMGKQVRANSVNGSVRVSTSDLAEAASVNGSVEVHMGRSDWSGTLSFKTVNGSITVEMPGDLNTDVRFRSVNGRLQCDFPLTLQGSIGRGRVSGTIGKGGRELNLETVNGSAELRRASM